MGQQLGLVNNLYEINLSTGVSVAQALAAYNASSIGASAQPDYALSLSAVPNDPGFTQQWALQNTGQTGGTPGDASTDDAAVWDGPASTDGPTLIDVEVGDAALECAELSSIQWSVSNSTDMQGNTVITLVSTQNCPNGCDDETVLSASLCVFHGPTAQLASLPSTIVAACAQPVALSD